MLTSSYFEVSFEVKFLKKLESLQSRCLFHGKFNTLKEPTFCYPAPYCQQQGLIQTNFQSGERSWVRENWCPKN